MVGRLREWSRRARQQQGSDGVEIVRKGLEGVERPAALRWAGVPLEALGVLSEQLRRHQSLMRKVRTSYCLRVRDAQLTAPAHDSAVRIGRHVLINGSSLLCGLPYRCHFPTVAIRFGQVSWVVSRFTGFAELVKPDRLTLRQASDTGRDGATMCAVVVRGSVRRKYCQCPSDGRQPDVAAARVPLPLGQHPPTEGV